MASAAYVLPPRTRAPAEGGPPFTPVELASGSAALRDIAADIIKDAEELCLDLERLRARMRVFDAIHDNFRMDVEASYDRLLDLVVLLERRVNAARPATSGSAGAARVAPPHPDAPPGQRRRLGPLGERVEAPAPSPAHAPAGSA